MAKKPVVKEEEKKEEVAPTGQGRAVTLPNGERRIDYIRDHYYVEEGAMTRGEIKTAINDMLKDADREDEQIPYQIVFQATKEKVDPRITSREKAAAAAAASSDEDAK